MSYTHESKPKCRKEFNCQCCNELVKKGDVYLRMATCDNGTARAWKFCTNCEVLMRELQKMDSWGEGFTVHDLNDFRLGKLREKGK